MYEATIYNRKVLEAVREGRQHPEFYAGWAYQNVVTVDAASLEEARREIARRYPEKDGFVVVGIEACYPSFGWQRYLATA
ncbi:MAG TPA: hypothetical protein VIK87_07650 [Sphingomonadales bacterium]